MRTYDSADFPAVPAGATGWFRVFHPGGKRAVGEQRDSGFSPVIRLVVSKLGWTGRLAVVVHDGPSRVSPPTKRLDEQWSLATGRAQVSLSRCSSCWGAFAEASSAHPRRKREKWRQGCRRTRGRIGTPGRAGFGPATRAAKPPPSVPPPHRATSRPMVVSPPGDG